MDFSIWLAPIAFFTAALTAIVGVGGGIALLAILAEFLAPTALIPVHGVVQLTANFSRSAFSFRFIEWKIVQRYFYGALIGGVLGTFSIAIFPFHYLPLVLGLFILLMVWLPHDPKKIKPHGTFFGIGILQTFLGFFLGATGPLTQPLLLRRALDRHQVVATGGVLITIAHGIKVFGYSLREFDIVPYLLPIAALSLGAIVGSWAGTWARQYLPEKAFRWIIKALLTFLALRMILLFAIEGY